MRYHVPSYFAIAQAAVAEVLFVLLQLFTSTKIFVAVTVFGVVVTL
jgi:hypothetical protein